jgi:hypothetical protein
MSDLFNKWIAAREQYEKTMDIVDAAIALLEHHQKETEIAWQNFRSEQLKILKEQKVKNLRLVKKED